jgi:hypothetical protein
MIFYYHKTNQTKIGNQSHFDVIQKVNSASKKINFITIFAKKKVPSKLNSKVLTL